MYTAVWNEMIHKIGSSFLKLKYWVDEESDDWSLWYTSSFISSNIVRFSPYFFIRPSLKKSSRVSGLGLVRFFYAMTVLQLKHLWLIFLKRFKHDFLVLRQVPNIQLMQKKANSKIDKQLEKAVGLYSISVKPSYSHSGHFWGYGTSNWTYFNEMMFLA